MSWARLYRLAMRMLPGELREKHGSAMLALFALQRQQARERSRLRGLLAGAIGVLDVVRTGVRERLRRMAGPAGSRRGGRERAAGGSWRLDVLGQDVAHALRSLLRAPRFTATVILTLALGMGASSALFAVVDTVLLRPLPFPGAERVVDLAWEGNGYLQRLSATKFAYWRDHARSIDAMATWRASVANIDTGEEVSTVRGLAVSHDFLRVLGYSPALGRGFVAAEHRAGGADVALISQALWRTYFAGAAGVVGRTIRLDGEPLTVIGVLPESFAFPYEEEAVEVLVPLRLTVDAGDVAEDWSAIARLHDGFTRDEAAAEVAALTRPFRVAYPQQASAQDRGMVLATFSELYVAGGVRRALWILMGAVTWVLLIACANVANLFLARSARLRGEMALRAALGATRGRVARLVLTECVLVALAAGAVGLVIGRWVAGVLVALAPLEVPRMESVGIDGRVMLFMSAAALATSLLFGGVAAWPAEHARLSEVLKETARGSSGRGRVRQGLLVAQSALSMMLLVGAALMVTTLAGLMHVDAGFDPEGLVAVRLPAKPAGYETSQAIADLQRGVEQQLEDVPAVVSIAGASNLPFERGINTPMGIGGRADVEGVVEWRAVTPSYFRTLGIALRSGRGFAGTDGDGGAPVAIVNETFARRYFGSENPIGHRIEVGRFRGEVRDFARGFPSVEIVGVVADIREASLRSEPLRTMYVPQSQAPQYLSNLRGLMPVFIVRGRLAGGDLESVVGGAIRAVDPSLPRPQVSPFADLVARSLARERFGATLLSVFAAVALTLTALGIYGVLAYTVQQRRREIGIRMALGAGGRQVRRLVIAQGVAPVSAGILLGVLGAIGLSRAIAGFLWGVRPTEPATLATVAVILLGVAVAASWIPARQATRLDPLRALHRE